MTEGRCNCSSIKVSIPALPDTSMICYCSNCRRSAGSIGTIVYLFDKSAVNISDEGGVLRSYTDKDTTSGRALTRQFCGNCGSGVATLLSDDSPQMILKGGLFDHIPRPSVKSFEHEEPAWMKITE